MQKGACGSCGHAELHGSPSRFGCLLAKMSWDTLGVKVTRDLKATEVDNNQQKNDKTQFAQQPGGIFNG